MNAPLEDWKGWYRKSYTILSVSEKIPGLRQTQYVEAMAQVQREAQNNSDPLAKTRCFWKMEKLSAEFFKSSRPQESLRDSALPIEVRPISHCGMGIGAVEHLGFELSTLLPRLDAFSDLDYRPFAQESIGAMLGVYAPGPFLLLSRVCSRMGIIPMADLTAPDLGLFLESFDGQSRRLLSHGFGRLLYFRNHSVRQAVRAASRMRLLDFESCIRGIAFAKAMVNSRDVRKSLSSPAQLGDKRADAAFEAGLVYALVFWEWMAPGFIETFLTDDPQFRRRAARAVREIESSRKRGFLTAFDLE